MSTAHQHRVQLSAGRLRGDLLLAGSGCGLVLLVHDDVGLAAAPRQCQVAAMLHDMPMATLRLALPAPARPGDPSGPEITRLAADVCAWIDWLHLHDNFRSRHLGLFGASAGSAAVLRAAAERPAQVAAVVTCGGRPDLALRDLARVQAPTLLILGGLVDASMRQRQRTLLRALRCEKRLESVPDAAPDFDDPGACHSVALLAGAWFESHLWGAQLML